MLPFASCYPRHSISSVASTNVSPQVYPYYPPMQTLGHHSEKYSKFANKTYGEVLKMYQTSYKKRPRCSELLSDSPKSASHHYKQTPSLAKKVSLQPPIGSDQSTANHGSDNSTNLVTSTTSKRKRADNPWITDELLDQINHGHDLYDKWVKVRKGTCTRGETDFRGGACSCPICMEKRSHYTAYNKHRKFVKKLKYQAKLAYFGVPFKREKDGTTSLEYLSPPVPSTNDPDRNKEQSSIGSNSGADHATASTTGAGAQSATQTVVHETPKILANDSVATVASSTKSLQSKPMAMVTAKKNFNPVSERDFGLQLRCGRYYSVGTDIPSNPEEKAILITNLRYDFNYHQSLMSLVKKYGAVEKLHCRFMKMQHIALVEFKDHKGALRFKMSPGKLYNKHPSIRKFWRNILPVPDSDAGFAAVQAHLTQPQSKGSVSLKNVSGKIPFMSSSSTNRQSQDSHGQFEMHVPAVVPCLEETGPSDSASNTHPFAPKRKPMLKLNSKPRSSEPIAKNIEIIDLEAVRQDSDPTANVAKEPIIVIIDDEEPAHPMEQSGGSTSSCTTARNEVKKEIEGETAISTDMFTSYGPTCDSKHSLDELSVPIFTPAGLSLAPHSFKILPPPDSEMQYIITGSLKPTKGLHRTLILRGIPYELNTRSKLSPSLTSFGRCKIMPRYLGLRTTACVRYFNNFDAVVCFDGAYKLLNLEYLKIFWMDKLPVPDSTSAAPQTEGNENTDEVELEIAPGNRRTGRNQFKSLRQKMSAYRTHRKAYVKERINKNYRWRTQPCGIINAKLIQKNQTLMSNNINSQKLILTRLESCVDSKTKERLMAMLTKLEKAHLVTTANLKVLHSSAESSKQSSDPQPASSRCEPEDGDLAPSNPYPKTIKVVNFSDQDVLQNHFNKFGKCTVVSYVVDKSSVVLCKFEKRKEAVIAFVRGREMCWSEWGNRKEKALELEWDFSEAIE